jgi:hypothetical protein
MDSPLILVALDLDFDCHIEHAWDRVWVHHNVFQWSPGVFKRVKQTLNWLQDHFNRDLWVLDNDYEKAPNLPRYLRLLGFEPCELIPHDGMIRTAFVRRLA